jgi:hypothetical protein
MNMFWLAADQPDEGERHVRESLASLVTDGDAPPALQRIIARAQTEPIGGTRRVRGD